MANELEIKIKAELDKLLNGLAKVEQLASNVGKGMAEGTKQVNDEVAKQTTKLATGLEKVGAKVKSIFHTMKQGAEIMAGLIGLEGALDIKDTITHSIKSTLSLADTVRKLGPVFNVAAKDFGAFQAKITKGMGEAGLSTEAAKHALEGLAETQVRGEAVTKYAVNAGELAEATGTKGSEGTIAKLLAGVTTAKGGNVNDTGQMHKIASEVLATYNATGMKPEAILSGMQDIFTSLPDDLKKSISTKGLAAAASTESVVPGAMKVITALMSNSTARKSMLQQGFDVDKMFKGGGFDPKQLAMAIKGILGRVPEDKHLAAATVFGEDAANAAVQFAEKVSDATRVAEKVTKAHADLAKQANQSRGLSEAFDAALDQTKATLSGYLEPALHATINQMNEMSKTKGGAAGVAGAGFMMGSLIFGKLGTMIADKLGMSAGSSMAGAIQGKAINDLVGGGVQNVYVINVDELATKIGAISGGATKSSSWFKDTMTALGRFAIPLGVGVAGGLAEGAQMAATKNALDKEEKGEKLNGGEKVLANQARGAASGMFPMLSPSGFAMMPQVPKTEVVIKSPVPGLKVQKVTTRGASMGPSK
jgi:hypothetical protein